VGGGARSVKSEKKDAIPRVDLQMLNAETFFDQFVAQRRPCIIVGQVNDLCCTYVMSHVTYASAYELCVVGHLNRLWHVYVNQLCHANEWFITCI